MEEEKGLTIGEIFKVIFKRLWWVIGVTAAVMIVFVCVVQFWYNPNQRSYSAAFELRLPGGSSYPDGTSVILKDSILLENLQLVKDEAYIEEGEKTGAFESIDVEKMVNEDDISFEQVITKLEDESYRYDNTVHVAGKYFKNSEQAEKFIRAVVEFPVNKAKYLVNHLNYTVNLTTYRNSREYEEKIDSLVAQRNYIVSIYDALKASYGGEYIPKGMTNGKTIEDYVQEMKLVFDTDEQTALYNEVEVNHYVYDTETYLKNIDTQITAWQKQITENQKRITDLKRAKSEAGLGDNPYIAVYDDPISKYTLENSNLEIAIDNAQKAKDKIPQYTAEGQDKENLKAFENRLEEICAELEQCTQTMKTVRVAAYNEKAQAIYVNNKIKLEGGLNIILAAVVGAVIGFVVVAVVVCIIDLPKYKKQKYAEQESVDKANPEQITDAHEDGENS